MDRPVLHYLGRLRRLTGNKRKVLSSLEREVTVGIKARNSSTADRPSYSYTLSSLEYARRGNHTSGHDKHIGPALSYLRTGKALGCGNIYFQKESLGGGENHPSLYGNNTKPIFVGSPKNFKRPQMMQ